MEISIIVAALITAPIAIMIIARAVYLLLVGIERAMPVIMGIIPTRGEIADAYSKMGVCLAAIAPWDPYRDDENTDDSEDDPEDSESDSDLSDDNFVNDPPITTNDSDIVLETSCNSMELEFYSSLLGIVCEYEGSKQPTVLARIVDRLNAENIGTFASIAHNMIYKKPAADFTIIVDVSDRPICEIDYEYDHFNQTTILYDIRYDNVGAENELVELVRKLTDASIISTQKSRGGGVYYIPRKYDEPAGDPHNAKFTEDILECFVKAQLWEQSTEYSLASILLEYGINSFSDPNGWHHAIIGNNHFFVVGNRDEHALEKISAGYVAAGSEGLWVIIFYDYMGASIEKLVGVIIRYCNNTTTGCLCMRVPGDEPVKKICGRVPNDN